LKINRQELLQLIKYLILGGVGAILDIFVFALLVIAGVTPLLGNIFSTSAGILVSYYLNSRYTFKASKKSQENLIKFFLVGIFGLILSSFSLWILIEGIKVIPIYAKIFVLPLIAIVQYSLNRKWSFGSTIEKVDVHL
jgi:putative flippase GtrA